MEISEFISTVDAMHAEAQRRGLFFQKAQDEQLTDRNIRLDGRDMLAFTSCSYLGLEYHPLMIEGVKSAVDRYGTQFSASRAYVSAPLYGQLESALGEIFGGHVLVTSSTTMGHQAALPVLTSEKDAIVFDNQVHHSVQVAITLARANGTTVEMVRHREIERSIEVVKQLARRHRTVYFACDGVYSMFGDLAPFTLLQELLDVAPNVRIYVDDAHGMSWAGQYGRGKFLEHMPLTDRIVVATSFAKAYAAGGGCLVFSDPEERHRVHRAGSAQLFNGPMQPPMLGAALASAHVHLSPELVDRQRTLRERVLLTNRLLVDAGLPLIAQNETPIFFVGLGRPDTSFAVAERLRAEDIYVNVSMYPTVPLKRSGIRLAITSIHSEAEIRRVTDALARHVPEVLREQGIARAELDALFEGVVPEESRISAGLTAEFAAPAAAPRSEVPAIVPGDVAPRVTLHPAVSAPPEQLVAVHHRSIHDVDRALWERTVGTAGACSWEAMALAERVYRDQPLREHNWQFHYLIVTTPRGEPICVTYFADLLHKDDMLMRAEVSAAVEERREDDPYFLTTRAFAMGGYMSEGNHLWLDRNGPWRAALGRALDLVEREYDSTRAGMLILRDLPADDAELGSFLVARGYARLPMLPTHVLDVTWSSEDEYVAGLNRRRSRVRMRERIAASGNYRVDVFGARSGRTMTEEQIDELFRLYRNVASRKLRLNVFESPRSLFRDMLSSAAWEIVTVSRTGADTPVAFYAAHVTGSHYAPFFVGIDYDDVASSEYGAYRQVLLAIVRRCSEIGMETVHLGMDADTEKAMLGTRMVENVIYAQVRDHYQGEILREIVTQVSLA